MILDSVGSMKAEKKFTQISYCFVRIVSASPRE